MFKLVRGVSLAILAAFAVAASAQAQTQPQAKSQSQSTWPSRPIMFIVPFPAGGGTDAFARPLAAQLDSQLGTRILIENRGGAGGTIGASLAARAAPDGHTFFIGAAHHTIAPGLYPKLDYDLEKDFIPIAVIAQPPQVVVVNPQRVAAKTLSEFIAYAHANPGKINYASAGSGTTHHLAGELFKILTQTQLMHVPYRGAGPAMQDLVAGHVDIMFDGLGSSAAQISTGKLRPLAVAAPQRSVSFPDIPTAAEAGLKGYEVSTWYAVWAPKGTPADIVARMDKELQAALDTALVKDAWARNGSEIPHLRGAEFAKFVNSEIARWGKVVAEAGVKPD
jgi:tripartite-type tricarboxylate transporter receptor subunit TctC